MNGPRLPDVHFGEVTEDERLPAVDEDEADNDDLLDETPQDVVDLLGFDPLEFEQ